MENRKHRRTSFNRDVLLDSDDAKKRVVKANDISTSGMGLFSETPHSEGESIRLTFDLVKNGEKREINIEGEIRHVQLVDRGYNIGVEFI